MHPRRQIREAFKARLIEAATAAVDRVYTSRVAPIGDDKDELPAILIYARDEKLDPDKSGYGINGENSYTRRELKLVVEGVVRGGETVDDRLDDISEQIEAALDDWNIPGFEGARVRLIESDIDVVTDGVKFPLGAIGLTYEILYFATWRHKPGADDPIEHPERLTPPDGGPAIPADVYAILYGQAPEPLIVNGKGPANP